MWKNMSIWEQAQEKKRKSVWQKEYEKIPRKNIQEKVENEKELGRDIYIFLQKNSLQVHIDDCCQLFLGHIARCSVICLKKHE